MPPSKKRWNGLQPLGTTKLPIPSHLRTPQHKSQAFFQMARPSNNTILPSACCVKPILTRPKWRCRNSSNVTPRTNWPATRAIGWGKPIIYARLMYSLRKPFLEGYQLDPQGPKVPDNLFKLGMSLLRLELAPDACAAFAKVVKDFPGVSSNIRKAIARERQINSCP